MKAEETGGLKKKITDERLGLKRRRTEEEVERLYEGGFDWYVTQIGSATGLS